MVSGAPKSSCAAARPGIVAGLVATADDWSTRELAVQR
jgi:hypothetical protein